MYLHRTIFGGLCDTGLGLKTHKHGAHASWRQTFGRHEPTYEPTPAEKKTKNQRRFPPLDKNNPNTTQHEEMVTAVVVAVWW